MTVKLLFDANLSSYLIVLLNDIFPDSEHLRNLGMHKSSDDEIWDYAKANSLTIVSKDSDFQQRSFLYGHPPKVIWLNLGNCSTAEVEGVLRRHSDAIQAFWKNETESLIIIHK